MIAFENLTSQMTAALERRAPCFVGTFRKAFHSSSWPYLLIPLCAVLSAFASFKGGWKMNHHLWDVYERKAFSPLQSFAAQYPADRHEAKLDLRLTVPMTAHLGRFGRTGIRALYILAGAGTLWLIYILALRAFTDKQCASLTTLAFAATPMGAQGFAASPFYDPVAIFLGLLALVPCRPWLAWPVVMLALFTDERSVMMLPSIIFAHSHMVSRTPADRPQCCFSACLIVGSAVASWLALRFWLSQAFGLQTPQAGVGWEVMRLAFQWMQFMTFSAFEMSWMIVAVALWGAFKRKIADGMVYAAVVFMPLAASFLVLDVGRSLTYSAPAFAAGLALASTAMSTRISRSVLLIVATGNLLIWNADYINEPGTLPPLVLQLAAKAFDALSSR